MAGDQGAAGTQPVAGDQGAAGTQPVAGDQPTAGTQPVAGDQPTAGSQSGAGAQAGTGNASGPTFAELYDDVFFSCASLYCHGRSDHESNLHMPDVDGAFDAMVERDAAGSACASDTRKLVAPGDPDNSLLVLKLGDNPPCGDRMPQGASEGLNADQIERVRAWIAGGAPRGAP